MSLEAALVSLRSAEEIIGGREYRVSSEQFWNWRVRSKCTAYDCEYVALAQDLGVPLVTADKQILRAFPKTAVSLEKFAKKKSEPEIEHHRDAGRPERRARSVAAFRRGGGEGAALARPRSP